MIEAKSTQFTKYVQLNTNHLVDTGGLIWVSEWNSLQQSMASALLTVIFSDYMLSSRTAKITCDDDSFSPLDLRQFAMSQVC